MKQPGHPEHFVLLSLERMRWHVEEEELGWQRVSFLDRNNLQLYFLVVSSSLVNLSLVIFELNSADVVSLTT